MVIHNPKAPKAEDEARRKAHATKFGVYIGMVEQKASEAAKNASVDGK